jgi:ATP-dependent DNA helicase RecQ
MLDEAHCLVQWGDSFRLSLSSFGEFSSGSPPAKSPGETLWHCRFYGYGNPETQQDIATSLQLKNPRTFALSPYRSHLRLMVKIALE